MMNPWVGRSVLAALIAICSVLGRAESLITPEKALDYRRAVDLHFSPDETTLAFIVLAYRDDYAPHVWLMDIASGVSRDIRPPKKSERSPQWSPDGKTLAFLSNRGGKVQVYAYRAHFSPPRAPST